MPRKTNTREKLIEAAMASVYERGYETTALADIAQKAGVPLGNVYYHFKTKDELGRALIAARHQRYEAMRTYWDQIAEPIDRLRAFVRMTRDNTPDLIEYGCPVGSLCTELQKQSGDLGAAAAELFSGHLQWLEENFKQLNPALDARRQAIHLLSMLEGATLLAHSFGDPHYINEELQYIEDWLTSFAQTNQEKR